MQRDFGHLLDIARAAGHIQEFLEGVPESEFLTTYRHQALVQHEFMLIGEAVKRLSMEFREAHHGIPWKAMAGMRDRLIHAYDDIDPEEVWRAAKISIPALLESLSALVPKEPS